MTSFSCALVSIGLITALFPISPPAALGSPQDQGDGGRKTKAVAQAIKGLSSDDESERALAFETFLRADRRAIAPLLELLKSLTPNIEVCPPDSNLPCRTGLQRRSDANKRTRLQSDAISLLGELHAVEAVPILLRILGQYDSEDAAVRYWGPEMIALVDIGPEAVPELLNTLRLAEERRRGLPLPDGRLVPYLEIQSRLVDVLGRIGDERALKLFAELREIHTGDFLSNDLEEAEKRIKERH